MTEWRSLLLKAMRTPVRAMSGLGSDTHNANDAKGGERSRSLEFD